MKHIQKQQQRFIEQLKEMVDNYHLWNNFQGEYRFAVEILDGDVEDSESEYETDDEDSDEDEYSNNYGNVRVSGNVYKFRPECMVDVLRFSKHLTDKNISYYMKSVDDGWEMTSPHGFMEIIRVADKTIDCHVIVDTFELKENYTGERKYRLNVEDIEMPC